MDKIVQDYNNFSSKLDSKRIIISKNLTHDEFLKIHNNETYKIVNNIIFYDTRGKETLVQKKEIGKSSRSFKVKTVKKMSVSDYKILYQVIQRNSSKEYTRIKFETAFKKDNMRLSYFYDAVKMSVPEIKKIKESFFHGDRLEKSGLYQCKVEYIHDEDLIDKLTIPDDTFTQYSALKELQTIVGRSKFLAFNSIIGEHKFLTDVIWEKILPATNYIGVPIVKGDRCAVLLKQDEIHVIYETQNKTLKYDVPENLIGFGFDCIDTGKKFYVLDRFHRKKNYAERYETLPDDKFIMPEFVVIEENLQKSFGTLSKICKGNDVLLISPNGGYVSSSRYITTKPEFDFYCIPCPQKFLGTKYEVKKGQKIYLLHCTAFADYLPYDPLLQVTGKCHPIQFQPETDENAYVWYCPEKESKKYEQIMENHKKDYIVLRMSRDLKVLDILEDKYFQTYYGTKINDAIQMWYTDEFVIKDMWILKYEQKSESDEFKAKRKLMNFKAESVLDLACGSYNLQLYQAKKIFAVDIDKIKLAKYSASRIKYGNKAKITLVPFDLTHNTALLKIPEVEVAVVNTLKFITNTAFMVNFLDIFERIKPKRIYLISQDNENLNLFVKNIKGYKISSSFDQIGRKFILLNKTD